MSKPSDPKRILITGASSGIGAALARHYAAPGRTLVLCARRENLLEAVARQTERKGAAARVRVIDVADRDATADAMIAEDSAGPLDLVIANAGISAGTGRDALIETDAQTRDIFAVNLAGAVNTIMPVLPRMQARRKGQIGLVSSVAGYRGFPGAPAYCASKAALKVWGEGLRPSLAAEGVRISVICPGFVDTPMTEGNRFPMPFRMSADRAARIVARGLARNRARITFPWQMALLAWTLQAIPPGWLDGTMARLPKKQSIPE